jgi:hypothetical protein
MGGFDGQADIENQFRELRRRASSHRQAAESVGDPVTAAAKMRATHKAP